MGKLKYIKIENHSGFKIKSVKKTTPSIKKRDFFIEVRFITQSNTDR